MGRKRTSALTPKADVGLRFPNVRIWEACRCLLTTHCGHSAAPPEADVVLAAHHASILSPPVAGLLSQTFRCPGESRSCRRAGLPARRSGTALRSDRQT